MLTRAKCRRNVNQSNNHLSARRLCLFKVTESMMDSLPGVAELHYKAHPNTAMGRGDYDLPPEN